MQQPLAGSVLFVGGYFSAVVALSEFAERLFFVLRLCAALWIYRWIPGQAGTGIGTVGTIKSNDFTHWQGWSTGPRTEE